MSTLLLLLVCVLIFSTSDSIAARWGQKRDSLSLCVTLLLGPFGYLLFGYLAAQTSLAKMGGYVNSGIVLCTVLSGIVFFDERLSRTGWLAIAIIMLGIGLLSVSKVTR